MKRLNLTSILFFILAAGLLILGSIFHLGLGKYETPAYIYGDDGDGFFNLWVMEHVRTSLRDHNFNPSDGRIYWPHNENTYFWSDNLLAPSSVYTLSLYLTQDIFTAYRRTAVLLNAMGYLAFLWLFEILFKLIRQRHSNLPKWSRFLNLPFAYLATFSSSRLVFFVHFQNLSSFWVITLITALIGYSWYQRRRYYLFSLISLVFLVFSSVYFAITGVLLFLAWMVMELVRNPRNLFFTLRKNFYVELAAAAVVTPIILSYSTVKFPIHRLEYIYQMATRPSHLYIPARGLTRYLYEYFTHSLLPSIHHESPAYLGGGLILGVVLLLIWKSPVFYRWLERAIKTIPFWGIMILLLLWKLPPADWQIISSWAGVLFWISLFILFLRGAVRKSLSEPILFPLAFLLLCIFIIYGIATGPQKDFIRSPVNPSIWGICSTIIPPLTHMRSAGRLAVLGQGLTMGIVLLGLYDILGSSKKWLRRTGAVAGLLIIIFQAADGWLSVAPLHHYNPAEIFPRSDEKTWWSERKGVVAVFPSLPFQQSTRDMLYFCGFPDIFLLNGYSGHSTEEWDRVMQLGRRWHEPNQEQIDYVESIGVNYISVRKDRVFPEVVKFLRTLNRPILFENNRLLVLETTANNHP